MSDAKKFFSPGLRYAVIGATINQSKYGYRVLKDLHAAGYEVFGVNPNYHEIDGIVCRPSLADLPSKVDVAVVVVPPETGLSLIQEIKQLDIKLAWFQPGAESAEIRTKAIALGIEVMADGSCIMVARRALGAKI